MPKILVVDDDRDFRTLLKGLLKSTLPDVRVLELRGPEGVQEVVRKEKPQLILLDWVMDEKEAGPAVCRELKADPDTRDIPIVILTGNRKAMEDRFTSVESGADLYVEKPFKPKELAGFIQALLAKVKARPRARGELKVGELRISRDDRLVRVGEKELPALPEKLFMLLWLLAHRSPKAVPIEDLIRHIWKNEVRDQQVAVAVSRLRDRLGPLEEARLEAVPGVGYRLRTKS